MPTYPHVLQAIIKEHPESINELAKILDVSRVGVI